VVFFTAGQFNKTGHYRGSDQEFIDSYEGDWTFGKINGKGLVKYKNGDSYKGGFKNGLYDGSGTYTFANGTTYEGKWKNGINEGKMTVSSSEYIVSRTITPTINAQLLIPSINSATTVIHIAPGIPIIPFCFSSESSKVARR